MEVKVDGVVTAVEFSPYEWSSSLLAMGTKDGISILDVKFSNEIPYLQYASHEVIASFKDQIQVTNISFSPQTDIRERPRKLRFAVAFRENCRYYSSDLQEYNVLSLTCHNGDVNDLAIEPHSGELIASVGDDMMCCVCSTSSPDNFLRAKFYLSSHGTSVAWYPYGEDLLMVGEKKGIIRVYNVDKSEAVASYECYNAPLMCARWGCMNTELISAVAGTDWFMWDIKCSSLPVERGTLKHDGVKFCFSHVNEFVIAIRSSSGRQITVIEPRISKPIHIYGPLCGSGLTFHLKANLLIAGGDSKLHVYNVHELRM